MEVVRAILSLLVSAVVTAAAGTTTQDPAWATYQDSEGRFTFSYPRAFGTPGPGTNDGFGDRVAAVRFSGLQGIGGEAVLSRGPVVLDVQALGGLYDPIALEVVPEALRAEIEAGRPVVTPATFCQILGDADHVAAAPGLPATLREAARALDRMRNIDPEVVGCEVDGRVATFHKLATFESGSASARQHIFGAVRFLDEPYSAFHVVRARTSAPSPDEIDTLARIVRSLQIRTN